LWKGKYLPFTVEWKINRPAFLEMIAETKKKFPPFQAILVWKLSRFARTKNPKG